MTAHTPYGYENRQGVLPISWEQMHGICKGIAQAVVSYAPDIILAVGRGGFYAGTLIAHLLQADICPVRLSRRVNDVITYKKPRWIVRPPKTVSGKRVLIVDEISSTGETLQLVRAAAERLGAHQIRCAVLYAHSWGTSTPDYIGVISDALILNPWDREILKDGEFQPHPEYVAALQQQGHSDPARLLRTTRTSVLAKG
jgi:hypothetical protein